MLLARAIELAPGGRLVLANFCTDESTGFYLGSTDRGGSLFVEISAALRDMRDGGKLTAAEFASATSPEYYRTMAEHKAPFEAAGTVCSNDGLCLS